MVGVSIGQPKRLGAGPGSVAEPSHSVTGFNDGNYRQLRDAQAEISRLRSLYDKQQSRADQLQHELLSTRRATSSLTADRDRIAGLLAIARKDKEDAAAALDENKHYVRKMEAKLTRGAKGNWLLE